MLSHLTFIAVLAVAPIALAQDQLTPTSREEIAQARAWADRLIAEGEAAEFFVNSTKADGLSRVTHVASGMTCIFGGGSKDRVYIFPQAQSSVPRGNDVGCISRDDALGVDLTLYATRYRPMPEEAVILEDAQRAIIARWPDAQPYTDGLPTMTVQGRSPTQRAAYKVRIDGADMLTMVLVTHREGWGFKARATGPYEDAAGVALSTNVMLEGALLALEN